MNSMRTHRKYFELKVGGEVDGMARDGFLEGSKGQMDTGMKRGQNVPDNGIDSRDGRMQGFKNN